MSLFGLSASGETRTARPHQRTAAAGRWTWNQNEYTLLRFFIFFVFSFSDARGTSLKSHSNHVLNQSVSPAESVSLCRFSLFVGQSAGRLLASKVNAFSAARTAESRRGADPTASPQAWPCHATPSHARSIPGPIRKYLYPGHCATPLPRSYAHARPHYLRSANNGD